MKNLFFISSVLCALAVYAQPLPPVAASKLAPVIVQLPTIDYGQNGFVIQQWTVNGQLRAHQVRTNYATKYVVAVNAPKNGGVTSNLVTTFSLVTNRVEILRATNGAVFAFKLMPPPVSVRMAFVIEGLLTSTNLKQWQMPAWFADEPCRFYRTGRLELKQIWITNNEIVLPPL